MAAVRNPSFSFLAKEFFAYAILGIEKSEAIAFFALNYLLSSSYLEPTDYDKSGHYAFLLALLPLFDHLPV